MIYCNSKRGVEVLQRLFEEEQMPCEAIHGQMLQEERAAIMRNFRQGETRVLVTTDLLCRGIDVQQVSLVINYDFPRRIESYIHRIGRSGRFGRKGFAINLLSNRYDKDAVRQVEQYYHTHIYELPGDISGIMG